MLNADNVKTEVNKIGLNKSITMSPDCWKKVRVFKFLTFMKLILGLKLSNKLNASRSNSFLDTELTIQ